MRSRHFLWAVLPLIALGVTACRKKPAGPSAPPRTLNVFAAASLTESFRDIGKRFEAAHAGTSVVFNFAGSQQLREQLAHGAPSDVFASANRNEMDRAVTASLVDGASVRIFARNTLVVIYPKDNPAKIATLADLARGGVKLDVADPAVPVGKYTMQMLDQMARDAAYGEAFKAKVLGNVVSREENVKSVLTKVRLGEADAGVVYATDAIGAAAKDVGMLLIPASFNQMAEYPIAVTAKALQPGLAGEFEGYVLSPEGQQILKSYGFVSAPPAPATTKP